MKRFRVLRYIAYTIEIIVFFVIQQTPGLIPSFTAFSQRC